jgi:glycosyltransferase 2 family protein
LRRWTFRALLAVACLALFVGVLRASDLPRAMALIAVSPGLWVAVVPAALATLADAEAWRRILAASGGRVSYWLLVRMRLSAEAVALTLPWGSVFGEGTALCLLRAPSGLAASRILAVLLSRRLYVTFAHGLVLGAAAIVGVAVVRPDSPALRSGLWAAPAACLALVAFATLAPRLVLRGPLAHRFPAFCDSFRDTGTPALAPFSPATALFIFMWLTESVESFIVLRALGGNFAFGRVFPCDVLVSLVRSLAIFAPGGLGFQDASYMALLAGGRNADVVTLVAAFVLVKRAREVLFASVGYLLILLQPGPRQPVIEGDADLAAWSTS